jgi:hypothetical protein
MADAARTLDAGAWVDGAELIHGIAEDYREPIGIQRNMEIEQYPPKKPNFLLIVILSVVVIIVLLIAAYFVVHRAAKHIPDGGAAEHAQMNFSSPQPAMARASYFAAPV